MCSGLFKDLYGTAGVPKSAPFWAKNVFFQIKIRPLYCILSNISAFRVVFSVGHSLKLWHCAIISYLQQSTTLMGEPNVTMLEFLLCNVVQGLHILAVEG